MEGIPLGIFNAYSQFLNLGEYECDLHPRYSSNLSKIAVDISGRGKRV